MVGVLDAETVAADPDDPLGTLVAEAASPNHLVMEVGGARWLLPLLFHDAAIGTSPVFAAYGLLPYVEGHGQYRDPSLLSFIDRPEAATFKRWAIPLADSAGSFAIDA